jgi:RNA polymerase sigma-70 factor (ECF subfamily)
MMDRDDSSELPADDDAADRAILVRLRDGDDLALNDLMDRWRKPILAYLYRTVGHYETAADLAQEVFVLVYRSRRRYRPKGNASSYLFTIASNLVRNHFRWSKRHPEAALDDDFVRHLESDPASTDPSTRLECDEDSARVRAAVQRLPEKLRTPVILFHFNELPQSEIARILRCSEKTVETRLYRARKLLRNILPSH